MSVRLDYSKQNKEKNFTDGDSRGGLIYAKTLANDDRIIIHGEAAVNLLDDAFTYNAQDTEKENADDNPTFSKR